MNKLIMLTLGALYLSACASTTPNLDARHGDAVRAAAARQMLNPMASSNADPVKGMDGKAAVSAMGRYNASFKEPPPAPSAFTIGVAGGGK
ncbi:MAG TPA: hypothetical protein VM532_00870 [Burkholderiales bacterium]|jgi:hypothetical protein|nr:hypothetical protein [Burkholderiales bacterium]